MVLVENTDQGIFLSAGISLSVHRLIDWLIDLFKKLVKYIVCMLHHWPNWQ